MDIPLIWILGWWVLGTASHVLFDKIIHGKVTVGDLLFAMFVGMAGPFTTCACLAIGIGEIDCKFCKKRIF